MGGAANVGALNGCVVFLRVAQVHPPLPVGRLTPSAADFAALARPSGSSNRPRGKINFARGINAIGAVQHSCKNISIPFFGNL
jgi:hypothetical protein